MDRILKLAISHTRRIRNSPVFVQVSEEEAVYERRLAEAGLTQYHQGELEAPLHWFPVHLLRQRRKADIIPVLLSETNDR